MGATSNVNALTSDLVGIADVIDPDVQASGSTVVTAWIKADEFQQFLAIVMAGTMAATSVLNAKIQQATDASGTGAKDITGKAITPLTAAGTDSDKQALINLIPGELDINNDFTHIQLSITVTVADSDTGAVLVGMTKRHGPASLGNAASVDEVVN